MSGLVDELGPPVQIAYVVPDVDAAARRWVSETGAGPFFVNRHIELAEVLYRGSPSTFDHSSAYGQLDGCMLELVQDHGTQPSVVRERYGVGETGLHHLAFIVDDLDFTLKTLVASGLTVAMSARTAAGTAFHFVDTVAACGHMVELYQRSPRLVAFYAMVAEAADGWDGSDPVRSV